MNKNLFQRSGGLVPGRSVFDLSYEKKFTCDMGELIPICCEETIPGDFWQIGGRSVIRFQPLVAPVLHTIDVYIHFFHVANRNLWDDWEVFITGGDDGTDTTSIPTWEPTTYDEGSLWDYLGFPVDVDVDGLYPVDFPRRAYANIYNEYYRDENLITEVALTNEDILLRAWRKDYFTSAMPFLQRGDLVALPVSGTTSAVWDTGVVDAPENFTTPLIMKIENNDATTPQFGITGGGANSIANLVAALNDNEVDLSSATTFDVNDIRTAVQIQKWMERNSRAGVRYKEFIESHFGTRYPDSRAMRPEYIGGMKVPVILSETLQTESSDASTPQGNMAGHGIAVGDNYIGKYRVKEFGIIMGIMSVMPVPSYSQGVNRQWIKETRYDYYFPEFAHLCEQEIFNGEICAKDADSTHNQGVFGYQGRYDELRYKPDMFCAGMRDTFDYWHLGRQFNPASPPSLNQSFIECVPRKDIFAAPSEHGLIVSHANILKVTRPVPIMGQPGLIDHF